MADRSKYYGYQNQYMKEHYKSLNVRVSLEDDKDILEFVQDVRSCGLSFNALMKEGIRRVMADKEYVDGLKSKK